jgi:hypothetical protein
MKPPTALHPVLRLRLHGTGLCPDDVVLNKYGTDRKLWQRDQQSCFVLWEYRFRISEQILNIPIKVFRGPPSRQMLKQSLKTRNDHLILHSFKMSFTSNSVILPYVDIDLKQDRQINENSSNNVSPDILPAARVT